VIADTPAVDGARIFGAIVPVIAVLGGFTCKSTFARDADTDGAEIAQRALRTILDGPALAHACGAQILGASVPVVAVFGTLTFRHSAASAIASLTTASAVTRRLTAPNQGHHGERADTHESE
jgi:hypothetical protein